MSSKKKARKAPDQLHPEDVQEARRHAEELKEVKRQRRLSRTAHKASDESATTSRQQSELACFDDFSSRLTTKQKKTLASIHVPLTCDTVPNTPTGFALYGFMHAQAATAQQPGLPEDLRAAHHQLAKDAFTFMSYTSVSSVPQSELPSLYVQHGTESTRIFVGSPDDVFQTQLHITGCVHAGGKKKASPKFGQEVWDVKNGGTLELLGHKIPVELLLTDDTILTVRTLFTACQELFRVRHSDIPNRAADGLVAVAYFPDSMTLNFGHPNWTSLVEFRVHQETEARNASRGSEVVADATELQERIEAELAKNANLVTRSTQPYGPYQPLPAHHNVAYLVTNDWMCLVAQLEEAHVNGLASVAEEKKRVLVEHSGIAAVGESKDSTAVNASSNSAPPSKPPSSTLATQAVPRGLGLLPPEYEKEALRIVRRAAKYPVADLTPAIQVTYCVQDDKRSGSVDKRGDPYVIAGSSQYSFLFATMTQAGIRILDPDYCHPQFMRKMKQRHAQGLAHATWTPEAPVSGDEEENERASAGGEAEEDEGAEDVQEDESTDPAAEEEDAEDATGPRGSKARGGSGKAPNVSSEKKTAAFSANTAAAAAAAAAKPRTRTPAAKCSATKANTSTSLAVPDKTGSTHASPLKQARKQARLKDTRAPGTDAVSFTIDHAPPQRASNKKKTRSNVDYLRGMQVVGLEPRENLEWHSGKNPWPHEELAYLNAWIYSLTVFQYQPEAFDTHVAPIFDALYTEKFSVSVRALFTTFLHPLRIMLPQRALALREVCVSMDKADRLFVNARAMRGMSAHKCLRQAECSGFQLFVNGAFTKLNNEPSNRNIARSAAVQRSLDCKPGATPSRTRIAWDLPRVAEAMRAQRVLGDVVTSPTEEKRANAISEQLHGSSSSSSSAFNPAASATTAPEVSGTFARGTLPVTGIPSSVERANNRYLKTGANTGNQSGASRRGTEMSRWMRIMVEHAFQGVRQTLMTPRSVIAENSVERSFFAAGYAELQKQSAYPTEQRSLFANRWDSLRLQSADQKAAFLYDVQEGRRFTYESDLASALSDAERHRRAEAVEHVIQDVRQELRELGASLMGEREDEAVHLRRIGHVAAVLARRRDRGRKVNTAAAAAVSGAVGAATATMGAALNGTGHEDMVMTV